MIQWTPHNHDLQSWKYSVAYFKAYFYVTELEGNSNHWLSVRSKLVANIRHLNA